MKPYDYSHRSGVRPVSWEDFASLAQALAEKLEPLRPQVILGVARAGLFPATAVAISLRCELFPIRLSRRSNDTVVTDIPVWKVPVPREVKGKRVVVIDEIADTGQTLGMAASSAIAKGASQVFTACLFSHSWADPPPDICASVSDAFIIFPWDQYVLEDGKWIVHPEIEAGLQAQSKNHSN
jgi:hypoxanthine phosphoribosyltransferase